MVIYDVITVSYLLILLASIPVYLFSLRFWNVCGHKFFKINRNEIQNIHNKKIEIPRFGGVLIIFSFAAWCITIDNIPSYQLIYYLIILSMPMLIIAMSEDLYFNMPPKIRLLSILISSILFFSFTPYQLPIIDLPLLADLVNDTWFKYALFTTLLAGLINGMNVIDGTNGLAGFTAITSALVLSIISFEVNDYLIASVSLYLSGFILIFLLFNYPGGKIFLGDIGAYWLGWILGILVIIFYGRNPQLPSWGACLILFYPSMEMIFSFTRKLLSGTNPTLADPHHLHLMLYFNLKKRYYNNNSANNMVMPALSALWFFPPVSLFFAYRNTEIIFIALFGSILLYLSFYFYIGKLDKSKRQDSHNQPTKN